MVTKQSSVEPAAAPGPPKVAVRAAEKRGYGVPMEQPERAGRPASDAGRPGDDGAGRGGDAAVGRGGGTGVGGRAGVDAGRGGGVAVQERPRRPRWRERISLTLDLIRANPTGRIALKIFITIAGALVVTIGIALIPLPGPGWLLVIAGLGIWAVEYHWARRLLGFTRRHVHGWTRWVTKQSLLVRIVLGSVGLVFVATVVWLSLKYSLGIDVVAAAMHYLATH
ncbi:PGPGW domain-containing protein [Micromonospora sp. H61]|uniref:PGPGW domain-containing protein n=1 Tax=Micromonospora sp. NPDC047187 TaxID=3155262 RepID=UPI001B372B98|nr:PGPGW domain-containing protein [Micromonospora sp. H61]MBQ0993031.1 PGPGW domain-containing protein [Micromonospora sp. H61]